MYDGLLGYEKVMLTLGIVTLIILLGLLCFCVVTGKKYVALLPALILPFGMLGFPAVKSINITNGVVELNREIAKVEANPTAEGAVEKLEEGLKAVDEPEREFTEETRKVIEKARAVRDLAQIAQQAESKSKSPEALNKKLDSLKQSEAAKLLKPEAYRKVQKVILRMPSTRNNVDELAASKQSISQARAAYLAAVAAYNRRDHSKYDQAFTQPMGCFYGSKSANIKSQRPYAHRTTTLSVESSNLSGARALADDIVTFCDQGFYTPQGQTRQPHKKIIVMRRQGSVWRISIEDDADNQKCAGAIRHDPCK